MKYDSENSTWDDDTILMDVKRFGFWVSDEGYYDNPQVSNVESDEPNIWPILWYLFQHPCPGDARGAGRADPPLRGDAAPQDGHQGQDHTGFSQIHGLPVVVH